MTNFTSRLTNSNYPINSMSRIKEQQRQYDIVRRCVFLYLESVDRPVRVAELEDNFSDQDMNPNPCRVALQMIADRELYFTEDRKIAISKAFKRND